MSVNITYTHHDGVEYVGQIMRVTKTFLGFEDHSMFTFNLTFESPGSGQGYGMFSLTEWSDEQRKRVATSGGMATIMGLIEFFGVTEWDQIKGQYAVVLRTSEWGFIQGLYNPDTDKYFFVSDFFSDQSKKTYA